MLDVNSLSLRIKTLMKSFRDGTKSESDYSLIMEPDFEHERPENTSKLDIGEHAPDLTSYGAPSFNPSTGTTDLHLDICRDQQTHIEASLRESCERELSCRVVFPENFLARVSEDILRMSVAEPCGWKGCAIILCLQEKGTLRKLATVFGSTCTPPTFEIHVTLKEDTRSWRTFQKMFLTIKGCLLNSRWKAAPRILHPAYLLEKRRLYRSIHYTISDHNH